MTLISLISGFMWAGTSSGCCVTECPNAAFSRSSMFGLCLGSVTHFLTLEYLGLLMTRYF